MISKRNKIRLVLTAAATALNVAVFGLWQGLTLIALVAAFWFGVYLPAALAWEYYHSDADERAEWRAFYSEVLKP